MDIKDVRSVALNVVAVIASVLCIISFFLPWTSTGATGLQMLTGDAGGLPIEFQAYLPTVELILMFALLIIALLGFTGKRGGYTPYSAIIFGFIALAIVVAYGNWAPEGENMILNGGTGMYLSMLGSCLLIFAGIAVYIVRPRPK